MKKSRSTKNTSTSQGDGSCSTGVIGLDDILGGGLPRDCFYLIQGDPGSGKTTLALQFLLEGVRRGEAGFFVNLLETRGGVFEVRGVHGGAWGNNSLLGYVDIR